MPKQTKYKPQIQHRIQDTSSPHPNHHHHPPPPTPPHPTQHLPNRPWRVHAFHQECPCINAVSNFNQTERLQWYDQGLNHKYVHFYLRFWVTSQTVHQFKLSPVSTFTSCNCHRLDLSQLGYTRQLELSQLGYIHQLTLSRVETFTCWFFSLSLHQLN